MGRATTLFPLAALAVSGCALLWPAPWVELRPAIAPMLGLVMLGMGMTLGPRDFARVLERPASVALGVALQYALMPAIGFVLARALALPPELAAGLVLVGSCPGGTASNVVCYLARGDVALSISLTTASTLLAVLATPTLTWLYVGQRIEVPVLAMLESVLRIVVLPVVGGVVLHTLLGARIERIQRVLPWVSVTAIVVIIGIVVALNRERAAELAGPVSLAVVAHNGLGLMLGYGAARALGRSGSEARTLAIEVGMQNSGLGVALASAHFSPVAALPGAIFSVWHNLSGAALASWWSRRPPDDGEKPEPGGRSPSSVG